jgi:guanylate kinase
MTNGKAIIFSAPSGAGKTTIVRHLLQMEELNLSFSISATTRHKRPHEVDGKDYHFIDVESFKDKIAKDEFIEWEEVYKDQFYGTLRSEIENIWKQGKHVIFDVDVVGGLNLKQFFGDRALAIFVKPPSIEALKQRLRNRSTETPEKIEMRISKAQHELAFEEKFDQVLINDTLEHALENAKLYVQQFLQQ